MKYSSLIQFLRIGIVLVFFHVFFSAEINAQKKPVKDESPKTENPEELKKEKPVSGKGLLNNLKNNLTTGYEDVYIFDIQWPEIAGNSGYAVQIRDSKNTLILEKTVEINKLEFSIPLGVYYIRVSALNKFGKPSNWSSWDPFTVDKESARLKYNPWKTFRKYTPCLGLFDKKHPVAAGGCMAWFAALSYAGTTEMQNGNRLARDTYNDPAFLTFMSFYQPVSLSYILLEDRAKEKIEYEKHQKNQTMIGGMALLSYGIYLFYMNSDSIFKSKDQSSFYDRMNEPDIRTRTAWMQQTKTENYIYNDILQLRWDWSF